jgi:hypothetical protein
MRVRNYIIELDRIDEDRWILAVFTTLIITLLTYILINIIKIPQNPVKPKEVVEFDFVAPEVKKKIIEIKPKEIKPQPNPEEKVLEEKPEVVLDIFMEIPNNIQSLPQDLPSSDQFKIFEQENPLEEHAQATIQITDGMMLEQTEFDPINVKKGFSSDMDNENIKSTIITPNIGDRSLKGNMGISTTIRNREQVLSNNFKGFRGDISWEEMLEPILEWLKTHSSAIGQVPAYKLSNNDNTAITAREMISVNDVKYELLLSCKMDKKQITICLVTLSDSKYVMLVDQGLTKTSTVFNTGKVRRNDQGEIVHFREGTYKNAQDPEAQEFMKIFWQWAKTVTEKG